MTKAQLEIENSKLIESLKEIQKYASVKPDGNIFSSNAWQAMGSIQAVCEYALIGANKKPGE